MTVLSNKEILLALARVQANTGIDVTALAKATNNARAEKLAALLQSGLPEINASLLKRTEIPTNDELPPSLKP